MNRKMKWWQVLILDLVLYGCGMGAFMLFDYVLPQAGNTGTEVSTVDNSTTFTFSKTTTDEDTSTDSSNETTDTSTDDTSDSSSHSKKSMGSHSGGPGHSSDTGSSGGSDRGNTETSSISSDSSEISEVLGSEVTETQLENYNSDDVNMTITKKEIFDDDNKITYYVADIYVSSLNDLLTAFADGTYGKNIKDTVVNMAEDNDAILAVSGDSYGNNDSGIVIRNGKLYRETENEADVCVLFTDGTMKTYSADEFDADEVIAEGAWQAWSFGPELLDGNGNVLSSFNSTSYLSQEQPRCAIGYVEPGHYVLMIVDGRQSGYSRGATLSELAQLMANEGCTTAYNLDGGNSIGMIYKGEYVNQPADTRTISDIIYVK